MESDYKSTPAVGEQAIEVRFSLHQRPFRGRFSAVKRVLGRGKNAKAEELRRHLRLSTDSRVAISWQADDEPRETSGRCLDISEGGARIEVLDVVPVSSRVRLRFIEDLNFEAYGVVRHSGGGFIGVEFSQMIWQGSLIQQKSRPLFARVVKSLILIAGLLLVLVVLLELPGALSEWKPFSGHGHLEPMPFGQGYFTLGSTKAEVQAVQGSPTTSADTAWQYGPSTVHFRLDRVVGWSSSPEKPLKVGVNTNGSTQAKADHFTAGSTPSEVLAVQGTPTELTENVWRYRGAEVYFRDGKVVGWRASPKQPLRGKAKGGPEPIPAGASAPSASRSRPR